MRGPLRKILSWEHLYDDRYRVTLECRHFVHVDSRTTYQARCWKCRKDDERKAQR